MTEHSYATWLAWTGSTALGYADYERAHQMTVAGTDLALSADRAFGGDQALSNPEQLLLARAHEQCFVTNTLTAEMVLEREVVVR
jgi:organic hydroperoxide reductase OsmC/OhrA